MPQPDDDDFTPEELDGYFRAIDAMQSKQPSNGSVDEPAPGEFNVDERALARSLDNALLELRPGLQRELSQTFNAQIDEFSQALAGISSKLRQSSEAMQQAQAEAAAQLQAVTRRSLGFMAATAGLLMLGTGYVVWHNLQQVHRLQVESDVRRALQQVTITACGKQPCIKLDPDAPRWGKHKEYILIDTDAAPAQRAKSH